MKGIIFDFDGVLCDSYAAHKSSFVDALSCYGYEWNDEMNYVYETHANKNTYKKLKCYVNDGFVKNEDVENIKLLKQNMTERRIIDSKLDPQVFHLLKWTFQNSNTILSIASDANRSTISRFLYANDSSHFFKSVVTSDDVNGITKPEPNVYTTTLESIELLPKDVVVFEDSIDGVTAAKSAGIHNVHLCTHSLLYDMLRNVIK